MQFDLTNPRGNWFLLIKLWEKNFLWLLRLFKRNEKEIEGCLCVWMINCFVLKRCSQHHHRFSHIPAVSVIGWYSSDAASRDCLVVCVCDRGFCCGLGAGVASTWRSHKHPQNTSLPPPNTDTHLFFAKSNFPAVRSWRGTGWNSRCNFPAELMRCKEALGSNTEPGVEWSRVLFVSFLFLQGWHHLGVLFAENVFY